MYARINKACPWHSLTACNGREFTYTWTPVPSELEDEARNNPYLEIQAPEPDQPTSEPELAPRKRRKGAANV